MDIIALNFEVTEAFGCELDLLALRVELVEQPQLLRMLLLLFVFYLLVSSMILHLLHQVLFHVVHTLFALRHFDVVSSFSAVSCQGLHELFLSPYRHVRFHPSFGIVVYLLNQMMRICLISILSVIICHILFHLI